MNINREFRTDSRLWLICGVVSFVLFGFVRTMTEANEGKVGPTSLWGVVLHGWSWWEWWRVFLHAAWYATLAVVPAVVLGWVAQTVVVTLRTQSPRPEGNADDR